MNKDFFLHGVRKRLKKYFYRSRFLGVRLSARTGSYLAEF